MEEEEAAYIAEFEAQRKKVIELLRGRGIKIDEPCIYNIEESEPSYKVTVDCNIIVMKSLGEEESIEEMRDKILYAYGELQGDGERRTPEDEATERELKLFNKEFTEFVENLPPHTGDPETDFKQRVYALFKKYEELLRKYPRVRGVGVKDVSG